MSQPTPLDITNIPELVRIAEEVEATKKPRVLKRDNTPIAMLPPVKRKQSKKAIKSRSFSKCQSMIYPTLANLLWRRHSNIKQPAAADFPARLSLLPCVIKTEPSRSRRLLTQEQISACLTVN